MRKIPLEKKKNKIKYLYLKKKLSLKNVAIEIGVSAGTIRKSMLLWNIPRRKSRKRDIKKPEKKKILDLYIDKKLTMDKVANNLDASTSTIFRWIKDYKIPTRRFKYKKYSFSGNPKEKAYILGLVAGDLHVRKHYRQILVELSTTHPAMVNLFYFVFQKYGKIKKYIKYNKITNRYGWRIYVLLDNSFDFLLLKDFDIDNEYFYDFLAGFFDSEGCLHIYNNGGYIGLSALIYNSNKKLLEIIKKRLEKDGFHPKFSIFLKEGEKITNSYYRRVDIWAVRLHTNKEVLSLMNLMPIKHREKLDKFKIVLSINSNRWEEISDQVNSLRWGIKQEVKKYIKPLNINSKLK